MVWTSTTGHLVPLLGLLPISKEHRSLITMRQQMKSFLRSASLIVLKSRPNWCAYYCKEANLLFKWRKKKVSIKYIRMIVFSLIHNQKKLPRKRFRSMIVFSIVSRKNKIKTMKYWIKMKINPMLTTNPWKSSSWFLRILLMWRYGTNCQLSKFKLIPLLWTTDA